MPTLNGMFTEPKPHKVNFIKENRKKLRQSSASLAQKRAEKENVAEGISKTRSAVSRTQFKDEKLKVNAKSKKSTCTGCKIEQRGDMAVFMQNKAENILSDKSTHSEKNSISTSSSSPTPIRKKPISSLKNQFSQTVDPNKFEELYTVGKIRYPSPHVLRRLNYSKEKMGKRLDSFVKDSMTEKAQKDKSKLSSIILPETTKEKTPKRDKPIDMEKIRPPPKSDRPTTASLDLNAAEIIRKSKELHNVTRRTETASSRSDLVPDSYVRGEVPKYLKERQKKVEEEKLKELEADPDCPAGHVCLPDDERLRTLEMLRQSYSQSISELNQLPVRSDTIRVRQKKIELEKKLTKLEEGMKIFNKSKVYVKVS